MSVATFTAFRQNMASYVDRVTDSGETLVVTRQSGKGNFVVLSEAEFAGWQETVHLLSSPRNAAWLMESLRQANSGETEEHALIVPGTDPGAA